LAVVSFHDAYFGMKLVQEVVILTLSKMQSMPTLALQNPKLLSGYVCSLTFGKIPLRSN